MVGRLRRVLALLRSAKAELGTLGAARLFLRLAHTKVRLLLPQLRSARRRGAVRQEILAVRQQDPAAAPQMALAVSGGIGDLIVIARFMRDLVADGGGLVFDVYGSRPGLIAWVFAAVPGFRAARHDIMFDSLRDAYDLALRASQFVVVYDKSIRWSALRDHTRLAGIIDRLVRGRQKIGMFIDNHPWADHFLAQTVVFNGHSRHDFLHHLAGVPHGGDALPVPCDQEAPARHGLRPGGYITVHNGFDTHFAISGDRATKCYPHFGQVVAQLKQRFPGYRFVQLGTTTSEPIAECDMNLIDKTDLPAVAGLLAQAALHIDNEGGLVHLAACFGTRSAVVFGPTPIDFFGYPRNINIAPTTCGGCWWQTRHWMDHCPKGYGEARCMTEQDPAQVAARIAASLRQLTAVVPAVPAPDAGSASAPRSGPYVAAE